MFLNYTNFQDTLVLIFFEKRQQYQYEYSNFLCGRLTNQDFSANQQPKCILIFSYYIWYSYKAKVFDELAKIIGASFQNVLNKNQNETNQECK